MLIIYRKNQTRKLTAYSTPTTSKQRNRFIGELNRNKNEIITKTMSVHYHII
jgi:hypothetical protein